MPAIWFIPALPVPEGWRKRWILPSPGKVVKAKRQKNYLDWSIRLALGLILGLTGEGPVMAGCFTRQPDGQAAGRERRALALVNMVDPGERKRNRATVSFAGRCACASGPMASRGGLEVEKRSGPPSSTAAREFCGNTVILLPDRKIHSENLEEQESQHEYQCRLPLASHGGRIIFGIWAATRPKTAG